MFKQKLQDMRASMLKAGVAPKYVKRTVQELQDHYKDIKAGLLSDGMAEKEAAQQAENQLGELQGIAEKAIHKKELQSFISLHPKLFFIVSPLLWYVLVAGLCAAAIMATISLFQLNNLPDETAIPGAILVFRMLGGFYTFLLPVLMAVVFVWMARQRLLSESILYWSIAIISVLGALLVVTVEGNYAGNGKLSVSLSLLELQSLLRMLLTSGIAFSLSWYLNLKALPQDKSGA